MTYSIRLRGARTFGGGGESVDIGELERADGLPAPAGRAVRLGHLSDFHFGTSIELDGSSGPSLVERWLEAFRRAEVDAVVFTGDAVEETDDRVGLVRARHLLERSGLSWVGVPGNHDVARPGAASPFYEIFGDYPRVERVGGVDFILLDSMAGLPERARSPLDRLGEARHGAYTQGRVGRDQLSAVDPLLGPAPRHPRVLVVHHHLAPEKSVVDEPSGSSAPDALMVPCLDGEAVLEWARGVDVGVAFHGHMHAHWPPYTREGELLVFNSGSSTRGKPLPRARIIDLERDGPAAVWELEVAADE